jgi:hypothetical protein
LPERPYDVLFSMPWAGALLKGASGAGGAEAQILMVAGWPRVVWMWACW